MAQSKQVRTRFQVRKFIGQEYAVIDVVLNSTVSVHPTKEAAREVANHLNEQHKVATRRAENRVAGMLAEGAKPKRNLAFEIAKGLNTGR